MGPFSTWVSAGTASPDRGRNHDRNSALGCENDTRGRLIRGDNRHLVPFRHARLSTRRAGAPRADRRSQDAPARRSAGQPSGAPLTGERRTRRSGDPPPGQGGRHGRAGRRGASCRGATPRPLYFDRQQFSAAGPARRASPTTILARSWWMTTPTGRWSAPTGSSWATSRRPPWSEPGAPSLAIQVREPRSRRAEPLPLLAGDSPGPHLATWGNWGRDGGRRRPTCRCPEFLASDATWPAIDNALARQALGGLATPYVDPRRWAPSPDDVEPVRRPPRHRRVEHATPDEFVRTGLAARLGEPAVPLRWTGST